MPSSIDASSAVRERTVFLNTSPKASDPKASDKDKKVENEAKKVITGLLLYAATTEAISTVANVSHDAVNKAPLSPEQKTISKIVIGLFAKIVEFFIGAKAEESIKENLS